MKQKQKSRKQKAEIRTPNAEWMRLGRLEAREWRARHNRLEPDDAAGRRALTAAQAELKAKKFP